MLIGGYFLVPMAYRSGMPHFWASLAFLISGFLVFAVSSTYHFLHDGWSISTRLALLLEDLDHFSIYLFIAGTYTPVLLNGVTSWWRNPLLIAVWTIAFLGILYTATKSRLPQWLRGRALSTSLFVVMGWTLILRLGEVGHNITSWQAFYLVGGVIAYSAGAIVYALQRPRLLEGFFGYHELWHLLVLTGAGLHYGLVVSFYAL